MNSGWDKKAHAKSVGQMSVQRRLGRVGVFSLGGCSGPTGATACYAQGAKTTKEKIKSAGVVLTS